MEEKRKAQVEEMKQRILLMKKQTEEAKKKVKAEMDKKQKDLVKQNKKHQIEIQERLER